MEETASGVTLSARLQTGGIALPPTLWLQFPRNLTALLVPNGDPFFPAALLLAMAHGRQLVIEADVSSALLAAVPRIVEIFRGWGAASGHRFECIEVRAKTAPRAFRGQAAGVFFSGGVDSFYTLLHNISRYPANDSRLISHLILVHGWDIPLERQDFFETVRSYVDIVAREMGKTLVLVQTNVRDVLRSIDWSFYGHGPAMASVGLALGRLFHTVFIAGGIAFGDLPYAPVGSHPALDPLWSTEQLEFVHDGADARRADKIPVIASSPLALQVLRVCWENRDGAHNCGRCSKCLRTMVELELYGALKGARCFPQTIDPRDIAQLILPVGRHRRTLWRGTLVRVRDTGGHPELIEAIETALTRGAWSQSPQGRICGAVSRLLSRVGLSPRRLMALDCVAFRGAGLALFRRVQQRMIRN